MTQHDDASACRLAELTPESRRNTIVRNEKPSPVLTLFEETATLMARAAKAGVTLNAMCDDFGTKVYVVSRWSLTLQLDDREAVFLSPEQLAQRDAFNRIVKEDYFFGMTENMVKAELDGGVRASVLVDIDKTTVSLEG